MADNSKISGFDTLSTLRFEGFTERNMSEMEQILLNLSRSKEFQSISELYLKLYNHIHSSSGHNIDITPDEHAFISQLYDVYRRYGNTGSVTDMLMSIVKQVQIATNMDVDGGFNDTKAVTAAQCKRLFNKHLLENDAHRTIYNAMVPKATFTAPPALSYTIELNDTVTNIPCSDIWNSNCGVIVIKYIDREHPSLVTPSSTDTGSGVLVVGQDTYELLHLYGNVDVVVYMFSEDYRDYTLYLKVGNQPAVELPRYSELGKDALVLCYDEHSLSVTTSKEKTTVTLDEQLQITNINPCISFDRIHTRRFTYYTTSASSDEIRFLLN